MKIKCGQINIGVGGVLIDELINAGLASQKISAGDVINVQLVPATGVAGTAAFIPPHALVFYREATP